MASISVVLLGLNPETRLKSVVDYLKGRGVPGEYVRSVHRGGLGNGDGLSCSRRRGGGGGGNSGTRGGAVKACPGCIQVYSSWAWGVTELKRIGVIWALLQRNDEQQLPWRWRQHVIPMAVGSEGGLGAAAGPQPSAAARRASCLAVRGRGSSH